jgi:hypothetical protein
VRCPKCLNILPEPANVSVYQCGGCNTTLRGTHSIKDTLASQKFRTRVATFFDKARVATCLLNYELFRQTSFLIGFFAVLLMQLKSVLAVHKMWPQNRFSKTPAITLLLHL